MGNSRPLAGTAESLDFRAEIPKPKAEDLKPHLREPYLHIRTLIKMNALNEAHASGLEGQDYR